MKFVAYKGEKRKPFRVLFIHVAMIMTMLVENIVI